MGATAVRLRELRPSLLRQAVVEAVMAGQLEAVCRAGLKVRRGEAPAGAGWAV